MECCTNKKVRNPIYKLVNILLLKTVHGKEVAADSMDEVVRDIVGNECKCDLCFCGKHYTVDKTTGEKYEIVVDNGQLGIVPVNGEIPN